MIIIIITCAGCSNTSSNLKVFPSFSTQDLNGNNVTDKLFSEKKITIVIIWATNMPTEKLTDILPKLSAMNDIYDDVQVIGLVGDVREQNQSDKFDKAKKIIAANTNFKNLLINNDFNVLLETITQVPITFFVDSRNHFIGQAVIGNDVVLIRRELLRLLDDSSQNDLKFIQDNIFF